MVPMITFFRSLGPGLLYAGAAIGVSHLVQSTRAGAEYGFQLIWVIIVANVIKYPFFEIGPRYTVATGKSLLEGYRELGRSAVILYLLITIGSMFIVQAAVTVVTAGLAAHIFRIEIPLWVISSGLLAICGAILAIGRYKLLDRSMRLIILTLTVSTIIAVVSAFSSPAPSPVGPLKQFDWSDAASIAFLIALVGWMPAPIDISIWHSLWTIAKKRQDGHLPSMRDAIRDFHVGYWGTPFLAVCFVSLGALVLYGSGEALSPRAATFAGQLIEMYTKNLGPAFFVIIAIAAFTTMFSTTLTVLDAYARSLRHGLMVLRHGTDPELSAEQDDSRSKHYWLLLAALIVGSLIILVFFLENMRGLVDFATSIAFLTAAVLAYLNLRVMSRPDVPDEHRQGPIARGLGIVGLVFLVLFSFYYVFVEFTS